MEIVINDLLVEQAIKAVADIAGGAMKNKSEKEWQQGLLPALIEIAKIIGNVLSKNEGKNNCEKVVKTAQLVRVNPETISNMMFDYLSSKLTPEQLECVHQWFFHNEHKDENTVPEIKVGKAEVAPDEENKDA